MVLLAGILCKNCKPLRNNILAATWCQCPDLAGSTPAPIQKKREPALTGQLSFCYDDKIGTRYKRGQKIRDHHRSDRSHESSLTYVRLTRPSFASAKLAAGGFLCRKKKKTWSQSILCDHVEHRNTIDATAFVHSQASGILFFTPGEIVLHYEPPELRSGDPASESPSG